MSLAAFPQTEFFLAHWLKKIRRRSLKLVLQNTQPEFALCNRNRHDLSDRPIFLLNNNLLASLSKGDKLFEFLSDFLS